MNLREWGIDDGKMKGFLNFLNFFKVFGRNFASKNEGKKKKNRKIGKKKKSMASIISKAQIRLKFTSLAISFFIIFLSFKKNFEFNSKIIIIIIIMFNINITLSNFFIIYECCWYFWVIIFDFKKKKKKVSLLPFLTFPFLLNKEFGMR